MTPAEIAELRALGQHIEFVQPEWDEMLDTIERLRGLLADAHQLFMSATPIDGHRYYAICSCDQPIGVDPDRDNLATAHAAHLAAILDGLAIEPHKK